MASSNAIDDLKSLNFDGRHCQTSRYRTNTARILDCCCALSAQYISSYGSDQTHSSLNLKLWNAKESITRQRLIQSRQKLPTVALTLNSSKR